MLYMVIETIRGGIEGARAVGERFREKGRMMPEGVVYVASWVEPRSGRCFQVMEAASVAGLEECMGRWSDLVEFEVVEVVTSAEFWGRVMGGE